MAKRSLLYGRLLCFYNLLCYNIYVPFGLYVFSISSIKRTEREKKSIRSDRLLFLLTSIIDYSTM